MAILLAAEIDETPYIQQTRDIYHLADQLNTFGNAYTPYVLFPIQEYDLGETLTTLHQIGVILTSSVVTVHNHVILATQKAQSYLEDFYYRVHLSTYNLNAGNVLGTQLYVVNMWNSFFTPNTLSNVTDVNLSGVIAEFPETLPFTFNALQSVNFNVLVDTIGDPNIDGVFYFSLSSGVILMTVVGQRAILWPFCPNLTFQEAKLWSTDILETKDSDTKFKNRELPRMELTYSYDLSRFPDMYQKARSLLWNTVQYPLATPQWSLVTQIGALASGLTVIPVSTDYLELRSSGEVVIVYQDYKTYDVLPVVSFTATDITVNTPTTHDYTNCFILPVRIGYAKEGIVLSRKEKGTAASATFSDITRCYSEGIWENAETFNGLPVVTTIPVVTGDLTDNVSRPLEFFDTESYDIVSFSPVNFNRFKGTMRKVATTTTAKYALRRFIDALEGKFATFYLPTFNKDLIPVTSIVTGVNKLIVEPANWLTYSEKYIRIKSVQNYYFQIIGVETDALYPGKEALLLSPTPVVDIPNIESIEVIYKVRADADRIETQYEAGIMKVTIPVIEEP